MGQTNETLKVNGIELSEEAIEEIRFYQNEENVVIDATINSLNKVIDLISLANIDEFTAKDKFDAISTVVATKVFLNKMKKK